MNSAVAAGVQTRFADAHISSPASAMPPLPTAACALPSPPPIPGYLPITTAYLPWTGRHGGHDMYSMPRNILMTGRLFYGFRRGFGYHGWIPDCSVPTYHTSPTVLPLLPYCSCVALRPHTVLPHRYRVDTGLRLPRPLHTPAVAATYWFTVGRG